MSYGDETSREALQQITEEGLLRKVSLAIYTGLHTYGPCTGSELAREMKREHAKLRLETPDWLTPRAIRARLGELRDRGAVDEKEPRICAVTGRRVIVWAVSGRLPSKRKKKRMNKMEFMRQRVAQLEEENKRLREKLAQQGKRQPSLFDTLRRNLGAK